MVAPRPVMSAGLWRLWLLAASVMVLCRGHGRLVDPPSRASAWRFGWNTPINYDDNQGFCGGFNYQYQVQGGRCGICGDAWDKSPRPHEAGGKYATGTIVRRYTEGQVIAVTVDITSNHRGHFEFRICPQNNSKVEASQTCLNEHPLFLADGSGFAYKLSKYNGKHMVHLQLPKDLTCTQCVFQWRYVAANNWGVCEDGTGRLGCGPQEEFRACADVAITAQPTWSSSSGFINETSSSSGSVTSSFSSYSTPTPSLTPTLSPTERPPPPPPPVYPMRSPSRITTRPRPTTTRPTTPTPTRSTTPSPTRRTTPQLAQTPSTSGPAGETTTRGGGGCRAVGVWQQVPGMGQWCVRKCNHNHNPPFCPASHCTCD